MNYFFWKKRWLENKIGFHQSDVNLYLEKYLEQAFIDKGKNVLIPLCGKSLDILFLKKAGYKIIGVEIIKDAVVDFFRENSLTYTYEEYEKFEVYKTKEITIFRADIFNLEQNVIGPIEYVYDRAALIAFADDVRQRYVNKIDELCYKDTKQLVISVNYDTNLMDGPPFSVDESQIYELYGKNWQITGVETNETIDTVERFKDRGLESFAEEVYILQRR